jgi:hypothetical protein
LILSNFFQRSLERKRKGGSFCVMGQGKIAQDGTSQFLALGAGFFALGYILGRQRAGRCNQCFADSGAAATSKKRCGQDGKKEPLYIDRLAELHSDFKMVLVVRNDLKMGKGKLASQCRSVQLCNFFLSNKAIVLLHRVSFHHTS